MTHRIEVIDRAYAAVLATKTPAERAAMIQDCHASARIVLAAGERLRHPQRSEVEVARAVAERLSHGTD
jgi:Xaa-Pro aminopeptidase